LRKFGVILLAEKVESEQEFQECKDLGFELFQGYYLRKPELIGGRRIPSNRLSVMALVAKCTDPKTSAAQVAEVTSRDPTLTYGLLRLANSALYTRRSEIRTPAEAVALLGMDTVFRWTTLLLLAGNDDCPSGYLELALQRARMAELIARSFDCREYDGYIVGLLSTLDSILNVPLAELVEPLPLDSRFKQALVSRQGDLGSLLKTVLAFESLLVESSDRRGLGVDVLQKAFWQAADYAAGMVDSFRATETRY
jgi:EAL and modified HD-GYP domain-containing signal transduction protein